MKTNIKLEESKKEIVNAINDISNKYELNYYLLEIIISAIYDEIKYRKDIELKKDYEEYNKEVKDDNI